MHSTRPSSTSSPQDFTRRRGRLITAVLIVILLAGWLGSASLTARAAPQAPLAATGLQFDGTNDYVTFGAAPGLGAQHFTVETWFKRTGAGVAVSTGTNGVTAVPLVTKGSPQADGSNVDENYILGIRASDNVLAADFETFAVCNSRPAGDNNPIMGVTPLLNNVWYHAAFTYDGAALKLYLNGNLENTLATTCIPRYDSIQHAGLGTYLTSTGTASGFFQGVLDEARIWNYARTQAQIQGTRDVEVTSAAGLIGRWGMNEGAGTTTADSSGGGFTGTLTNGPTWVANSIPPDLIPPAAPTGLAATAGNAQVGLTWNANGESDLAGYNVYRSTTSPVSTTNTPVNGATLVTSPGYNDTSVTNGIPYYYVVTAVDTSGNRSAASNEVSATPTGPSTGAALDFGGTNAYVSFGAALGLGVKTFTIETWFRRDGTGATADTGTSGVIAIPLVTKGRHEDDGSTVDMNYFLGIRGSDNVLVADFEESAPAQTGCPAGGTAGLNHPVAGVTAIPANGVWHHAAATYDGTTWRLYLDGIQDASLALTGGPLPRWDSIQHAALATTLNSSSTATPEGFFDGVLDEVRIWNVARTPAEIQATINSQLTTPQTGMIARWGLDEGSGTVVHSSAGTTIDGTIIQTNWSWAGGAPFNIAPPAPPDGAPSNLTATVAPGSQIDLAWTDGSTNESSFQVEYAPGPGCDPWSLLGSAGANAGTFRHWNTAFNTQYCYRVRAANGSGVSNWSNTVTAWTPPGYSALSLGKSSAYVRFPVDVLHLKAFTLETWFRREGPGVSNTTGTSGIVQAIPLIAKGAAEAEGTTADENFLLVIDDATDVIAADFEECDPATQGPDCTTGGTAGLNHPILGVTPIVNNTWYHAAVTFDGNKWQLFLNGSLERELVVGRRPRWDNTAPVGLGTSMTTGGAAQGFFDGTLDEVRIWDSARSQAEIRSTMNEQIGTATIGLVARWALDEGAGTAVAGSAGTTINGAIYPLSPAATGWNWTGDAPFNATLRPNLPASPAPADGATGVALQAADPPAPANHVDLQATVSDPDTATNLAVSFYGRPGCSTAPNFTLAVLPDTQYYSSQTNSGTRAMFDAQTAWLVTNQSARNIVYTAHMGDVVDGYSDTAQWDIAGKLTAPKGALTALDDAGMKYGVAVGNHDGGPSSTANFNSYFPYTRVGNGHLGSDNDNSYGLFSSGGMDFIVVYIEYGADAAARTWANDLLSVQYPNRRAIVVTHNLLSGNTSPASFTTEGQALYDAVKANPNLFLMLGGHLDTEVSRTDTYNGHTVYSLRSDYQFRTGGNGWLRLLEFQPAANQIQVYTYSPYLSQWETDADSQFTLAYAMGGTACAPWQLIATNTGVASGSRPAAAWGPLSAETPYQWYVTVNDGAYTVSGPIWTFTTGVGTNNPPTVTQPGDKTNIEGDVVSLQIVASDLDGDSLNYFATGLPTGLTINAGTGLIAGTISAGAASASPYHVTVTVSDGKGGSTPASFTWTVEASGSRPCGSDPTLVGCWPMEEGSGTFAADGGALPANTVTFVGAPAWVAGQSGQAISLNGTSQYGATPDEASLDIINQITIAAWIKPGQYNTQDLIKKATNGLVDGYELTLATTKSDASSLKAFFRINQAANGDTYRINATTEYPIDGTWMHVAATYDGTTMRLYINGIEESSLAASISIATNSLPLSIGAQIDGTRFFQGALDQVRVYNRALSAEEIAGLVGGSLPPTGLACTDLVTKPATTTTGEKPQSKVWRYAGAWWAVFPTNTSGASSAGTWLWKLVGTTWTEVLKLSDRIDVKADVKVVGDVIHALLYAGTSTQLASAQYNSGTATYAPWSARPTLSSLSLPNSEIATIDVDSTGRMWLATRAGDAVPPAIVVYYSDAPYSSWSSPITLATGIIANDDLAVVTALPGKIGVFWGNENASVQRFGFRTHLDGTDPNTWTADEVPASQSAQNVGLGMADDHMNVAVASDGTLYVAVKTSYDTAGYPKMALLVRRPAGTWDDLYGLDESGTRPIVLLDEANGVLNFIYTSAEGNNPIVYRQSALGAIAFEGKKTLQSGSNNDVSSSKGNYTAEFVTIFSNGTVTAGEICRPAGYPPQPPGPTIAKSADNENDLRFTWPKVTLDTNNATTTVLRYQVYRGGLPYFEPGDGTSLLPLDQPTVLTYDDVGVVPSTTAYYYVWRAVNAVGPSVDSKRAGKFTFTLTPGSAP